MSRQQQNPAAGLPHEHHDGNAAQPKASLPRERGEDSAADPAEPQAAAPSDRDAQGRFGKGNKGGPGNPYARQIAALRQKVHEVVTPEGMENLVKVIFTRALEGDMTAARLILQYSIGKPAETVNPDTLDIEEWKHWQANATRGDVFSQIMNMLPADVAVQVLRGLIPVIGRDMASFMVEAARDPAAMRKEYEEHQQAQRQRKSMIPDDWDGMSWPEEWENLEPQPRRAPERPRRQKERTPTRPPVQPPPSAAPMANGPIGVEELLAALDRPTANGGNGAAAPMANGSDGAGAAFGRRGSDWRRPDSEKSR